MKTKILLLLIFTTSYLNAQVVNIPDPIFLQRLLNHHIVFGEVEIDTNHNGQIEVSEAEAITSDLIVYTPWNTDDKIVDMTGIEAFSNITGLNCSYNQIETLDLSQNTLLTHVDCSTNNINSLNVSGCTDLVELICWDNQLPSIDVSQNHALTLLDCHDNYINSIDVTQNIELTNLGCSSNNLSSIDVSENTVLTYFGCNDNNISNIDVSHNIALVGFGCNDNNLSSLDVTQNSQLHFLSFRNNNISSIDTSECPQLEWLWAEGNQLTNIDLSQNPNLAIVKFQNNQLINMDIRNGNNSIIGQFDTTGNPLLTCIFVDDKDYSTSNWLNIDETSHFVETQAECESIGTEELHIATNFALVPNPVEKTFRIDTELNYNSIAIYNTIGNLMEKYDKQDMYFLKDLVSGVYVIQIKTPEGLFTKKLIKK